MTTAKELTARFGLAAILVFIASSLSLAARPTVASAAPAASTPPGHTIATAGTLDIGDTASGGGGAIDFWHVHLNGGDRIQLLVSSPTTSANYTFQFFKPGTTDASFPAATSFSQGNTGFNSKAVIDLQAPFNGNFILAVCESGDNPYNCVGVDSGGGQNPMDSYHFSTSYLTKVPDRVATKEVHGSPTIGRAMPLSMGNFEAGGANGVDFWKVKLYGGDRVQLVVTSSNTSGNFTFQLFQPGTTNSSFPAALSFSGGNTGFQSKAVIDVQAPFNGTFILAVCESGFNPYNCVGVDSGTNFGTMDPYTFTPTLIGGGVSAGVASREVRASAKISRAASLTAGHFQAGGANAIDYWRVSMLAGDKFQFAFAPANTSYNYTLQLFPPGTNDSNFPSATAVATGESDWQAAAIIDLRAPRTGTYVLAVCESGFNPYNCVGVDSATNHNPMDPYTFTPKQVGGLESKTSLKLSAATVLYHHEKTLKFSVAVRAVYSGKVTGKVNISDGKKSVCRIKLVKGKGSCSPPSNTTLPVGKYKITAYYYGNFRGSHSAASTLTVKK